MTPGIAARRRAPSAAGAFAIMNVALPLLAGAAIYVAWRATDLYVFRWLGALGLSGAVATVRVAAAPLRELTPDCVVYSLPDGLWVYAAASFFAMLWRSGPDRLRRFWMATPFVLAVGWELAQRVGAVPGTFDPTDLAFYVLGAAAAGASRGAWLS